MHRLILESLSSADTLLSGSGGGPQHALAKPLLDALLQRYCMDKPGALTEALKHAPAVVRRSPANTHF